METSDREDIHLLASRLDDVMDLIDGTAHRVQMYHAGEAPQGAILLADVVYRATKELLVAVQALEKNKDKNVLDACAQVKRLEEKGDSLYHEWVGRLFDSSPDPLLRTTSPSGSCSRPTQPLRSAPQRADGGS